MELIGSVTLASDASNILISSIPSTYKSLVAIGSVWAGGTEQLRVQYNNVTTAIYRDRWATGEGSTELNLSGGGRSYVTIPKGTSNGGTVTDSHSAFILNIEDYADSAKDKSSWSWSYSITNVTNGISMAGGVCGSNFAINSLQFSNGDTLRAGTTISVYGVL